MINNIILRGRLVADPELRTTSSGIEVASFTIAVDRDYTKQGEEKQTDFIPCSAWQKTGVFVQKYFAKGKEIEVQGRLESRKFTTNDGQKRTAYEVNVHDVWFVGPKGDGAAPASAPAPAEDKPLDIAADDDFLF